MGNARAVARWLLTAVLRNCPEDSREWAEAMLRELDFIEGDWAALWWALGGATAIFRHSGWVRAWFKKRKEDRMNDMGKKTVGLLSGIGLAVALVLVAFGLLFGTAVLFPSLGLDHAEWIHVLTIVIIPETIFVTAAILLWRKRTPTAVGILLTGLVLVVHVLHHFVRR